MFKSSPTIIKKLSAVIIAAGFFVIFICFAPPAQAATSTVMGLGYWEGNGYVSFNCANDVIGDQLGIDGNFNNLPEPRGFHFYAPPCKFSQHAVVIDAKNNFSGQAWNDKQEFISFSGSEPPPDGYNSTQASGNCPNKCNADNHCWACYNETEQKVYGWAKIDNDNNEKTKWINLSDSSFVPPTSSPVRLKTCNNSGDFPVYNNVLPGDFIGYASNSHGNLSFNCESEAGGSACSTRDYGVYISNLTIGSLSAPNWTYSDACLNALGADLKWCVRSGKQSAYEIVITHDHDYGATPPTTDGAYIDDEYTFCHYTANSDSAADFYPQAHIECPTMGYNQDYYWWIRLYDDKASSTDWYQYYGNSTGDTDKNIDGNVRTFTTYKNKFPIPYSDWSPEKPGFQWSPDAPQVGSTTKFTSEPYYYDSFNNQTKCTDSTCIYRWWSTTPGLLAPTISSSSFANTDIVFSRPTSTNVSLTVTVSNSDHYSCTWEQIISNITYGLPVWREIKAQ